ncbi:translocation/assembly module TamB domain-containing protein [Acidithiobacillus sp. IBUN Pt1247-S3]|uniref:translocation/assembly module TamB domain-containing protein n=1 Tax=Acidithiobacillus sp. IBUN Pt1247-S3 TaxID=3166642 RepID=UPI0034E3A2AD
MPIISIFVLFTWLFLTSAGANWALALVPGLHYRALHGNIAHGLRLQGISYVHGNMKIKAQEFSWGFQPVALLWGEAKFSSITLQSAQVWLPPAKPSKTALNLAMPQIPDWLSIFSLRVAPLQIDNLRIYQNGKETFSLDKGECEKLAWQHGTIQIRNLRTQGSFGKLTVTGSSELAERNVTLDATWQEAKPKATSVTMQLDWHGLSADQYGGPITVALRQANSYSKIRGLATISPQLVELSKVQLISSMLSRPISGDLTFRLPKAQHGDYSTKGSLRDIAWEKMPKILGKTAIHVAWDAAGTESKYHGSLAIESEKGGLNANFEGAHKAITLLLAGHFLQGKLLRSEVRATFGKAESVRGKLAFRQIPLQIISSALPGQLSADLQIDANSYPQGWQGTVRWNVLPSQIYLQKIQGNGDLQFAGKTWQLKQATLQGPGLRLQAQGNLAQRLKIAAQVDRWSGILPGANGDTRINGWVAQDGKNWQGELHLQGNHLHYQKVALGHIDLDGSLTGMNKVQAKLNATGLAIHGQTIDLQSVVSGSLQQADIRLAAQDGQKRELKLAGILQKHASNWKLDLLKLAFHGASLGQWSLYQPSTIEWKQGRASINNLRVDGANGASIRVTGNYGPLPTQGDIDATAQALPLDFWDSELHAGIRGRWNAQIHGHCDGTCQLNADWGVKDTALHWEAGETKHQVAVNEFAGNLHWQKDGLRMQSNLLLADHLGKVQLEASSPAVLKLPWKTPQQQPIQATVTGHVPGLLLSQLPTGNIDVDPVGNINVDLRTSGTWSKPLWQGRANASGLGCYIPEAGLHLQDISADVTGNGDHLLLQGLTVHSGSGSLHGHGDISFSQGIPYQIHITGENFLALNLPQVQAAINPTISIQHEKNKLQVTGKLETTRLRILGTDFGGPKPSSDVVFVHEKKTSTTPSELAVDIHIGLGKNAKVLIGGLAANLEGNLQLRMLPPSTTPLIQGTLEMVDGKYEIYGNSLTFEKGKILFNGAPQAASLDVLAVRSIKNSDSFAVDNETILAGVQVTGNLSHPVVNLYSKPSMAQNDILSYLILGTPSTGLQSQDAVLSAAAGQLFSAGRAAVLGNSLNSTGIDFGVSSSGNSGGLAADMVTLGHYITPNLYFSVGQSVLGDGTIARLRYSITRHVEIQTESGTQDGANIFYRIDF